jgi:hypothetical protein
MMVPYAVKNDLETNVQFQWHLNLRKSKDGYLLRFQLRTELCEAYLHAHNFSQVPLSMKLAYFTNDSHLLTCEGPWDEKNAS